MREDECVNSSFHQTSRCFQHQIIPLTIVKCLLRFQLCVVDADSHASVLTDHELGAVGCNSVGVGHAVNLKCKYKPSRSEIVAPEILVRVLRGEGRTQAFSCFASR